MKTCVIIPAYNEEGEIEKVTREIIKQGLTALVIDDGSSDNTAKFAQQSGALVIKNEVNEGKGASLIKGFNYARENNFDAVITMDGDGQHSPADIPFFLRLATYSDSAILVGNRMLKTKNMPFLRLLTNKFMSWLISLVAKQKIPDTQCGFRLIKKEVLNKIDFSTTKYETESEILIKSSRKGFKIESVPITTIYRGEKSQINPFVDTLRFLNYIIKEIWTTRH
ncbi:MAG: glycosyltransferase family 2 protein [Candidatus Omnitrophica bacterium]|nr:glycosyltransferase family 2 protein [Candidatus Omnitrophota bacterium]